METLKELADKLFQLRTERRIPSYELAKAIGVEPPMYSRMEHGSRSVKFKHLQKIADFYEIECRDLEILWAADKLTDISHSVSKDVFESALQVVNEKSRNF